MRRKAKVAFVSVRLVKFSAPLREINFHFLFCLERSEDMNVKVKNGCRPLFSFRPLQVEPNRKKRPTANSQ
jgi:hypothetical protein